MSRIRANTITNQNANGAPNFPDGITVSGVVTATTLNQAPTSIVVGSAVTANSNGVDTIGIVTAGTFKDKAGGTFAPNPTTTQGDIIVRGASVNERLAIGSAGQVLKVNSSANGLEYGGGGITNAQQFRLAANQSGSGSNGTVLTNWEEVDTNYQAIGSNWSQSSGVFSCSATGIYMCFWSLVVSGTSTGDAYDPNIQLSSDSGSNWSTRSRAWTQVADSAAINRQHVQNQLMFDVSTAGTFRLRMRQSQDNDIASGTTIGGSSSESLTNIMFIRLGDT